MILSKSLIDKAGAALAKNEYRSEEEYLELERVFDEFRKSHLQPLTETTLKIQKWLTDFGHEYYIAQRLKRKPQIIRELNRFHSRLTQLQDIGGCRIVVEKDANVSDILKSITSKVGKESGINLVKPTDYRELGRDDSGYRALHLILEVDHKRMELQVRSRIQHYWAENIERTSVIYGHYLKEGEGNPIVINYFKKLSDIFYEIESGREPTPFKKLELDKARQASEDIIANSDGNKVLNSYINEDAIKTLASYEEKRRQNFNNWILVFDWNQGNFVSWEIVDRDPDNAIRAYIKNEENFPAQDGFEVVMIGSSNIATVSKTHSHYFGIEKYDTILESLDHAVAGFARRPEIDAGARQILLKLSQRGAWSRLKAIAYDTLKNHFCRDVFGFDSSLKVLIKKGSRLEQRVFSDQF